jgi:hypothetical protein
MGKIIIFPEKVDNRNDNDPKNELLPPNFGKIKDEGDKCKPYLKKKD